MEIPNGSVFKVHCSYKKTTPQIKTYRKFEGGNGPWIWERFQDKSSICEFFLKFLLAFTSCFEAFSCFDFCQKNLVKENMNLWQIWLFFCTTKCTLRKKDARNVGYTSQNCKQIYPGFFTWTFSISKKIWTCWLSDSVSCFISSFSVSLLHQILAPTSDGLNKLSLSHKSSISPSKSCMGGTF